MNIKVYAALAAVALLAGCNSPPATTGAATGAGTMASGAGPSPGGEEDFTSKAGDRIFFEFNQSSVSEEARGTLDKQAAFLGQYPQDNVQVAGNCDDRGTAEFNLALGQRRANADRDYLVARGVSGGRITTISYGKDRPVALGDDDQAWSQNRNAITTIQ